MLDKNEGNLLLDFYGSLLTDHQIEILDDYFKEDLSMNEIAENNNISKAAVSDIINRALKQLTEYENKLNLISNNQKLDKIVDELNKAGDFTLANKINDIIRR